jgi:hypothetical protein
MQCPKCGRIVRKDWNFCAYCSKPLKETTGPIKSHWTEEQRYMQGLWGLTSWEVNALARIGVYDAKTAYAMTEEDLIKAPRKTTGTTSFAKPSAAMLKAKMKGKPPK